MINTPSDHRLVGEWLAAGADLASDIIPIIERIASEVRGRTGQTPFRLKLFDEEIRRKLADEATFVEARKLSVARMNRLKIEQGEQA